MMGSRAGIAAIGLLFAADIGCIGNSVSSDHPPQSIWPGTVSEIHATQAQEAGPTDPQDGPDPLSPSTQVGGSVSALSSAVAGNEASAEILGLLNGPDAPTSTADGTAGGDMPLTEVVVDPLDAVDLAVTAVVDALAVMDPLRSLSGVPLNFAQMPATGLHEDCPTVAYVATEDSASWALAIDFSFRNPNRNPVPPTEPCREATGGERAVTGVLGFLHRRGESLSEVVSEHYVIGSNPVRVAGHCAMSGAMDTTIAAEGELSISCGELQVAGVMRFEVAQAGSLRLDGDIVQLSRGARSIACRIAELRSQPAENASFWPDQGRLTFVLVTGQTVQVEFDESSPATGTVLISVDGGAAAPYAIPSPVGE